MDITGIGAVAEFARTIVDKLFPDADAKRKDEATLLILQTTQDFQRDQGQLEINKVEAANPSLFVSGWRPFIGWTCGAACAWNWIGISVVKTGCAIAQYNIDLSQASLEEMLPILLGLLGLGTLRTVERIKGKQNNGR